MASTGGDETPPPSDVAPPDELLCAICIDLLLDPCTSFPCGHSFCGACVGAWMDRGRAACPTCGSQMSCVALSFALKAIVERTVSAGGVAACRERRGVPELTSFARRSRHSEPPLGLRRLHGLAVAADDHPDPDLGAPPPVLPEAVLRLLRPRNLLCLWLSAFSAFFAFFAHHNLQLLLADPSLYTTAPPHPSSQHEPPPAPDWPPPVVLNPDTWPPPVSSPLPGRPPPQYPAMNSLASEPQATALLIAATLLLLLAAALLTVACGLALGRHAALLARLPRRPPLLTGGAAVGVCGGAAAIALSLVSPPPPDEAPLLGLLRAHQAAADPSLRLFWETYVFTVGTLLEAHMSSLPALALRVFFGSFVLFVALLVYAQMAAQRPVIWEQLGAQERGQAGE
jgi:hypothetical protein